MQKLASFAFLAAVALPIALPASAQQHPRYWGRMDQVDPVEVPGGTTFRVHASLDHAFEAVLNGFKRKEYAISNADRELGQIATAITFTGGYSQTGSRVIVTFIKDAPSITTVRVTATVQKRKKLIQTEPWSNPKLDAAGTEKAADEVKGLFPGLL